MAETRSSVRVITISPWARATKRGRIGQIAAKRRLAVGASGHEPEVRATAGRAVVEEPGDRFAALVLVWFGRHRQPSVVGEERDDALRVAALDRGGEMSDKLALAGGIRQWRALEAVSGEAFVERRTGSLQRPFDRAFAAAEGGGSLGCVKPEHVAEHECDPLARWQVLQRR
jgi:hypothetical protein